MVLSPRSVNKLKFDTFVLAINFSSFQILWLKEDPVVHSEHIKHLGWIRCAFLSICLTLSFHHNIDVLVTCSLWLRLISFLLFVLVFFLCLDVFVGICSTFTSQNIFKTLWEREISEKQTQSQITRCWDHTRFRNRHRNNSQLRASKLT